VIDLLSLPLFLMACAVTRNVRGAASLAVGTLCTAVWLWPVYRAWQGYHPDGSVSVFLQAHGLSAALLLLVIAMVGAVWWMGSVLTSLFACPEGSQWLVARTLSHGPAAVLLIALTAGYHSVIPVLLAAWSIRPLLCGYLRLIVGVQVRKQELQGPSRKALGAAAGLLCVLALSAVLWPEGRLAHLNLSRVFALRAEAVHGQDVARSPGNWAAAGHRQ
jgi:hypothetical protein